MRVVLQVVRLDCAFHYERAEVAKTGPPRPEVLGTDNIVHEQLDWSPFLRPQVLGPVVAEARDVPGEEVVNRLVPVAGGVELLLRDSGVWLRSLASAHRPFKQCDNRLVDVVASDGFVLAGQCCGLHYRTASATAVHEGLAFG